MSSVELQEGVLRLSGELDHVTSLPLREQAGQLLTQAQQSAIRIDCSGVTRANSAGLALLLALLRDAEQQGKTLSIIHLPAEMQQMAHVCELTAILQPAS